MGKPGANQGPAPKPLTKEQKEYQEALKKIEDMKKESEEYNTPENFSKYGKMQRQILKLEKELKTLKEKADQSLLNPQPEAPEEEKKDDDDDNQLIVEEARNTATPQNDPFQNLNNQAFQQNLFNQAQ